MELASTGQPTVAERPGRAEAVRRPAPSIRRLTDAFVVVFGILALAATIALVWTSRESEQAMEQVVRDTAAIVVLDDLELAVARHRRLSDLHTFSREPELEVARAERRTRIRELLARAREQADTEQERRGLRTVEREIQVYLARRAELERSGAPIDTVLRQSEPPLQQAIASLDALRARYSEEIGSAHARTVLIQRRARLAGAAAASLLLAGLLAVAVAVRRWIVSPLVELQGALRRHRAGEIDARATPRGGAEMREVMEEFEDLTAALRSQRAAQLTYLAGVAHDLRNPLAALRAAALVARAERDEATRARAVELFDRQIGRIERMVGDLLDATRIEAGEVALELAPVDLRAVCAEVVRLYSSSTRTHTLELSAASDPVVVQADALRLEQVVGNLVSNAIKYSPRGGPVRVAVSRRGDRAVIEVVDRGIGMSAEQAASAFLPFRRSAAGVAPGVGLGLSVVRRIVEAHGGSVEVESALGVGSTFRVVLPLAAPVEDAAGAGA